MVEKNSLNRLIRCVCGKKIGPDPRNFNQRVSLGRNDLLIRTFLSYLAVSLFTDPDKHGITSLDFSLLSKREGESELDSDEQLMSIAESIPGGVRYVPASG
ncbi:phage tail assembly protein T [Klebsiella pneumoniae]|uniref:phage tail assembly protein T n=1 Tax=Klebsiella pneumoniae TaxID=573 RepID=UPI001BDE7504|nr:phage tail assembly protein T [Klebsiella pneumoniae]